MPACQPTTEDLLDESLAALSRDRDASAWRSHADNLNGLLHAMAAHGKLRHDPVRTVPSFFGDRWSSLIMNLLIGGMLRHAELRRLICIVSSEGDISQRMMTLKLRLLERDGLVARNVTADVPPRVEYELTPLGLGAYEQYLAVLHWSEQATPSIRAARAAYDATHADAAALCQAAEREA